jgi:AcrR family transcriptional regulator
VTEEAGLSRAAFYRQFDGKEECFLATYDLAGQWLCDCIEGAAAECEEWPVRVRAGVAMALRLLAANPELAHLLAVEGQRAGPAARERQRACLSRFAAALRSGRPGRDGLPAELEELLIGGVLSLVARYVETGRTEQLPEATAELVHCLLILYLESEETRRIADQAA